MRYNGGLGLFGRIFLAGAATAFAVRCSEDPYSMPNYESQDRKVDNILAVYSTDKVAEMSDAIGLDLAAPENGEVLKEVTLAHVRGKFYSFDEGRYWKEASWLTSPEQYSWFSENKGDYYESTHTVSKKDNIEIRIIGENEYDAIPGIVASYPYGGIDVYIQRMHGSRDGLGIGSTNWDIDDIMKAKKDYPALSSGFADDAEIIASNCDLSRGFRETDNTAAEALAELFGKPVYASKIPVYHHYIGSIPRVETMYHYGSFEGVNPGRVRDMNRLNDSIRNADTPSADVFRKTVKRGALMEKTPVADIYGFDAGSITVDGVSYTASVSAASMRNSEDVYGAPAHGISVRLTDGSGRFRDVSDRGLDGPDDQLIRQLTPEEVKFGNAAIQKVDSVLSR
jgi:hypothetical protein